MSEKEYVYALSDDGPFIYDSEEEAVEAIFEPYLDESEVEYGLYSVYRCEKKPFKASDFLDVDGIIERMQEEAYSEMGEYAYGWLDEITSKQAEDLRSLVDEWATKNGLQPEFFMAENVTELDAESIKKAEEAYE